ncbi:MAG: rRNA maturation RNase YbeY, partial [Candidatus Gastranaerophilales bacterium]|nr:rRNA maturation RNase YbeY [Candidatus Gastranaerophilales bacterium]
MRTRVWIDNRYGLKIPLKRKVSSIVKILFENEIVSKKSAVSGFFVDCVSFDIVFVNGEEIQSLNKKYRKIDAPTDVITFALFADDENKFVFDKTINLGEIIISVEKAEKQAKNGLEEEILTLICHG